MFEGRECRVLGLWDRETHANLTKGANEKNWQASQRKRKRRRKSGNSEE
jgi:hypothetical protein